MSNLAKELQRLQQNFQQVKLRVAEAAKRSGREMSDVKILAVTKLKSVETIRTAYMAGMRTFGENYVEETLPKMEVLSDLTDIRWDMIGHVQSRKAKQVANNFSCVHSLSSEKLARLLDRHRDPELGTLDVLVQVNVSGEASKQGIEATNTDDWPIVLGFIQSLKEYAHLKVRGLMTMPPLFDDPEKGRGYFRRLRELKDFLNLQDKTLNLHELSMGTSNDFEIAVEEGATIIRLGSVLLGSRI